MESWSSSLWVRSRRVSTSRATSFFPFYPPFPFNFPREPHRKELRIFPSSLRSFPDPKHLRFGEENKQSKKQAEIKR